MRVSNCSFFTHRFTRSSFAPGLPKPRYTQPHANAEPLREQHESILGVLNGPAATICQIAYMFMLPFLTTSAIDRGSHFASALH